MPVSARDFALFTQQDIGQFRKGLELNHKLCISSDKIDFGVKEFCRDQMVFRWNQLTSI